jgi:hypothetical protein
MEAVFTRINVSSHFALSILGDENHDRSQETAERLTGQLLRKESTKSLRVTGFSLQGAVIINPL